MARTLTRHEKILARHYLQLLMEGARQVRDAMDPNYGRLHITDEVWQEQWLALRKHLDEFTESVIDGRGVTGMYEDRNRTFDEDKNPEQRASAGPATAPPESIPLQRP